MDEAHRPPGSESSPEGLTEMRILLLGNKASGKSSSIRTILCSKEPNVKTAQCVKIQGEVAGVAVTMVEAPGWWRNYMVKDTPNLNAEEIVLSVSLCPPGPHVLLLVIRLDTHFTETCRQALEERQALFQSGSVWSHSMVLFTFGDCLGDTTLEKHIESEGEALQWLVKVCGNRFHVFNNKNKNDSRQVMELLEKIEDMVRRNSGRNFEVNQKLLQDFEVKRRRDEMKAMERLTRVQKQKQATACATGPTQPELRILLVGHRHSGKSATGNTILGREEFELRRTSKCVMKEAKVAGRLVTVVEAPGWWNNYCLKDAPQLNRQELLLSASLCPPGPHILLLVLRADGSFTWENKRPVEEHLELFGEKVWDYTMVLFTYGDWLGETSIEQHIESEGLALQWVVEKCGNRYHVLNNNNREDSLQMTELLRKIEELVAANGPQYCKVDSVSLEEARTQWKTEKERAKLRLSNMMEKRQELRSLMGEIHPPSELRIVMLGRMYSGKSSTGNTILGSEEFTLDRHSRCVRRQRKVGTRDLVLIEAPYWFQCVELTAQCAPGPHALLLVIQADSSFTETNRRTLEQHIKRLDERVWNYAIVLFTCGDWLGDWTVEEFIESEGKALRWVVEMCMNRYHVLNNQDNSGGTQVTELLDIIEEMVAGNGGHLHIQVPKPLPVQPLEHLELNPKHVNQIALQLQPPPPRHEKKGDLPKMDQEKVTAGVVPEGSLDGATPTFTDKTKYWKFTDLNIHKARSMQHSQPTMGGDDRLDTSSDYSSEASLPESIISNTYGSLMSMASSDSSGFGSLRNFGAQGCKTQQDFMKRPKLEEDNTSEEVQEKGHL